MGTYLRWRMVRLATLAVAFAGAAAAQEPLVRTGEHFVVHFHTSKLPGALAARLADDALAAAESTWPAIDKLLGLRSLTPPVLHVYAEPEQFRALEQQHRAGLLPVESFALLGSAEAHLLLWPQLSQKALEITGLPDTTRQAIMSRSAQLAAAAHSNAAIEDPWLAEVFGYAVLEGLVNPKQEFGIEPAYDTRRMLLHYDFEQRNPRELHGTILDFDEPKTPRESEAQEENKCIMAQMMAASGGTWAKKLLGSTAKKGSPRVVTRVDAVEKVLGTKWLRTESLFAKLCQKVKPVWRESAPMAALRGDRLLVVGDPDRAAQFHALLPPPDGAYAIRGRFEVKPCGEDSFRLQIDWDEKSMIGCWFGVGRVRVERWNIGGDWEQLAEGKAPILAGVPFEGAVEVGDTVRVLVDGHEYCAWERGDRKMHGLWSFGVNDCVTFVEKLRIEPLHAAKK
ncbi:MAG TPA: hypothetical protein VFZ65_12860 [Planctomycetota bacterium]|nr:hypothetical protein [Planctomycetota bacterium]